MMKIYTIAAAFLAISAVTAQASDKEEIQNIEEKKVLSDNVNLGDENLSPELKKAIEIEERMNALKKLEGDIKLSETDQKVFDQTMQEDKENKKNGTKTKQKKAWKFCGIEIEFD